MTDEKAYELADEYKQLVYQRTKIRREDLVCPRARSFMTPCIARDGKQAVSEMPIPQACVGCGHSIESLLEEEKANHQERI